jgi:dihydroorotate dehydrogenase electron transfer subunit
MRPHRGTIFLDDDAQILDNAAFAAEQYILRIRAPKCAAAATPGSFAHIACDASLPMRRPLSIMRADRHQGWIDILYKAHGAGLALLAKRKAGDTLSVMGPIGAGFSVHADRPRAVLIGGGVGIPPLVFLAEQLSKTPGATHKPIAFFGSEIPFAFRSRPSALLVPGMPAGVIACMPLLEGWGVPCRLASFAQFPGCFDGYVTDLAAHYLQSLDAPGLGLTEIFACGPTVMLKAVARLARRFGVPAQVSLEEFMACAVGGCAGCAVAVQTPEGPAMKRVCVDGPVFDAAAVFPLEPGSPGT